jgi:sialic acid synthase SpsE
MVFVIAECGVNWRNLSEADEMIKAAAEDGADAAKFQCYDWHQIPILTPRYEEICKIALTEPDIRYLYWRCQQHGIEFMCTPMYPEAVEMLDPYVKRWKVRYADRISPILAACYRTGKIVLVSEDTPRPSIKSNKSGLIRCLYCVPEYPPKFTPNYDDLIGFDGYSCHIPLTENIIRHFGTVPGLEYLEVHVRLDKYDPAWDPVDQRVSITMSELRQLCKELGK